MTTNELRAIIREELQKILAEGQPKRGGGTRTLTDEQDPVLGSKQAAPRSGLAALMSDDGYTTKDLKE